MNIKNLISTTFLGAAITFTSIAPTIAAPIHIPAPQNTLDVNNSVVDVRHRGHRHHRHAYKRGKYKRHNNHYRGSRHHRGHRYSRSNRNIVPYIIGGVILGSAIAQSSNRGSNHVRWCDRKYRSYDVRSDTFQPYNGPRKRCNSPYR